MILHKKQWIRNAHLWCIFVPWPPSSLSWESCWVASAWSLMATIKITIVVLIPLRLLLIKCNSLEKFCILLYKAIALQYSMGTNWISYSYQPHTKSHHVYGYIVLRFSMSSADQLGTCCYICVLFSTDLRSISITTSTQNNICLHYGRQKRKRGIE